LNSPTESGRAAATAVLVTGASGFVGRHVVERLERLGYPVIVAARPGRPPAGERNSIAFDLRTPQALAPDALRGVKVIVHAAARVHVMQPGPEDARAFHQQNVDATLHLARVARRAGVERFVFVSSIKVHGERSASAPFVATDRPAPLDDYGRSKLVAEVGLARIAADTGLEVVVVRPPLVYGAGVGGNFRRLLEWVNRGVPLPFGGVRNARSLVSVWNLADLLARAALHPAAAGHTFLVADGPPVSTPALVEGLAAAMGRPSRLVRVPMPLLRAAAVLLGRSGELQRLCGSLVVADGPTREILGWTPPIPQEEALRLTAESYMRQQASSRYG
jgi:UDP-glucose 4-epimerase